MVTSKETRLTIIALRKSGLSCAEIAAKKIASESTVYRILQKYKETGAIEPKKASGRPRVSTQRQDRLLLWNQLLNRVGTSVDLAKDWKEIGVTASARTVRRRLLDNGLVAKKLTKKTLSTKKNIEDNKNVEKEKDSPASDSLEAS